LFVEYENEISAQEAVSQLNNYRLDKSHSFKVNFFDDFEKYKQLNLNKEIEGPAPYKNPGNLYWWLTNNDCYDQFCLQHGDIFTSVYLNTPTQPSILKSREVWIFLNLLVERFRET
jgi:translation initiation factor 3 subunit B